MKILQMFSAFILSVLLLLLMLACGSTEVQVREQMDDGYYQNHVRSDFVRNQLDENFSSVRRVQNTVTYKTYQFYIDDLPLRSELAGVDLSEVAANELTDNQSTAGTAIVLSGADRGRVALLSAAHTVTFPDTIWHYSDATLPMPLRRVEAVSVRQNVNQFVFTDDGIEMIELLVADNRRDLAILKTESRVGPDANLVPLQIPAGNVSELSWGDMIYAAGYPRGVRMVTQGTVSITQHPIRTLIMDISLNRGFSGGAVYAVRSDGSGLEWIGVITSTMGERERYLVPEELVDGEHPEELEYTGQVFVRTATRIYYGMTNAVDIDIIREFINEHRADLQEAGLHFPNF